MTWKKQFFFLTLIVVLVCIPLTPALKTQAGVTHATVVRDQFGRPAIPTSNRATYAQVIHLTNPIQGINVIPSGQSAFFALNPSNPAQPGVSPETVNQRLMFRNFDFLPTQMSGQ
jgi:hypothetical protein